MKYYPLTTRSTCYGNIINSIIYNIYYNVRYKPFFHYLIVLKNINI